MTQIATLYRTILPAKVRAVIYDAFLGKLLQNIRGGRRKIKFIRYKLHYTLSPPKTEKEEILKNLLNNCVSAYPYPWVKEYTRQKYSMLIDESNHLPYVMHHHHKLYFKREMLRDLRRTKGGLYKCLQIEQDIRSPHRYVESYEELRGKTLLDIGAAEAIFTLDCIEYVDHAYLFECDEGWIEALQATFAPWKDKVTIVRNYVSDKDEGEFITLDTYFKDKPIHNLFLKMDIEGFERKALRGAHYLLENSLGIAGSVCVYHLSDDETVIKELLEKAGLQTYLQPGYLYFEEELRSALLRFKSDR